MNKSDVELKQQIININDLSIILGRSVNAIRISLSRGDEGVTIPSSIKLGGKRVWLRSKVEGFINELEEDI